jgi:hypothetical protein
MTLREYLGRRTRRFLLAGGAVAIAGWNLTIAVIGANPWGAVGSFVPLIFILLLGLDRHTARCPRCATRLNYIDYGSRKWGTAPRVGLDRCTGCGLHLNDQLTGRRIA